MSKCKQTPWGKYSTHRNVSIRRGIEFLLTFDEWMKIWSDSGHWNERGTKKGQYCMSRFNDIGSYSINNVKILLHEENVIECNNRRDWANNRKGKKQSIETREKIRKYNQGRKREPWVMSEEIRIK